LKPGEAQLILITSRLKFKHDMYLTFIQKEKT